jgi:TPP-dependent pyruvate/acetoin dehydrogenase alpha subunit
MTATIHETSIARDPALARTLLFQMKRIRFVEEEIARRYPEGRMRCPTHLSIGQEAVAAAVGAVLRRDDLAVGTHRAHAHYLGKGGSLRAMLAEIYGKVTGCSRGRGGSMHLVDLDVGFEGSTAIVGNSIPIGVGLALAAQLRGTDQVSCVFVGDGAIEEGVFYEAANFAVVRRLPVVFLCENNLYSVYSPLSVRQPPGRAIHGLVAAIGLATGHGDGNDVDEVYAKTAAAVARVRAGDGPCFLEYATYRWREHCGPNYDNDIGYRTEAEYLAWRERDPVTLYERKLMAASAISEAAIATMQSEIEQEVADAFRFAEDSPFPEPAEAFDHVYC